MVRLIMQDFLYGKSSQLEEQKRYKQLVGYFTEVVGIDPCKLIEESFATRQRCGQSQFSGATVDQVIKAAGLWPHLVCRSRNAHNSVAIYHKVTGLWCIRSKAGAKAPSLHYIETNSNLDVFLKFWEVFVKEGPNALIPSRYSFSQNSKPNSPKRGVR